MTQWLQTQTALIEGWSSVPSTHIRQLTTACDSRTRAATPLTSVGMHSPTQKYISIHNSNNKKILKKVN